MIPAGRSRSAAKTPRRGQTVAGSAYNVSAGRFPASARPLPAKRLMTFNPMQYVKIRHKQETYELFNEDSEDGLTVPTISYATP